MLFEYITLGLDVLYRRFLWLLLPILICVPAATLYIYMSPMIYTANAVILLQPANLESAWSSGSTRYNPLPTSQVQAIDAWLKSDAVLDGLLPQIIDGPVPENPADKAQIMEVIRTSLSLTLQGDGVLSISLRWNKKKGLGKKLEIFVAHLMDGLMRVNEDLLSAPQLILLQRKDRADIARQNLVIALDGLGLKNNGSTISMIRRAQNSGTKTSIADQGNQMDAVQFETAALRKGLEFKNTNKPRNTSSVQNSNIFINSSRSTDLLGLTNQQFDRISAIVAAKDEAEIALKSAQRSYPKTHLPYISIFASPEKLVVMGRPRDPVSGKPSDLKLGVVLILLSILLGAGLVIVRELTNLRVRVAADAALISGVPVVVRVPPA